MVLTGMSHSPWKASRSKSAGIFLFHSWIHRMPRWSWPFWGGRIRAWCQWLFDCRRPFSAYHCIVENISALLWALANGYDGQALSSGNHVFYGMTNLLLHLLYIVSLISLEINRQSQGRVCRCIKNNGRLYLKEIRKLNSFFTHFLSVFEISN